MEISGRPGPATPGSSRIPRTSRRKACQKCVEAKAACDLRKPKCKRCRDRGISCEYPAHAKSKSGATADNQFAPLYVSPFSTISDAISLNSAWPEGLVKSTGNVPHTPSYPTITDSGPVHTYANATLNFQEIDFRSARAGLTCRAEESYTRPTWESWIVASAKRRTLFTMYLFTNVCNTQVGLPNFVAEELRGTLAPERKMLWEASNRAVWEREYNRHLSQWEDGMLEISELWRSAETGTEARREKIERWLQSADEFGMMFFSVCAHIHGC